jgi:hypothetical protein
LSINLTGLLEKQISNSPKVKDYLSSNIAELKIQTSYPWCTNPIRLAVKNFTMQLARQSDSCLHQYLHNASKITLG